MQTMVNTASHFPGDQDNDVFPPGAKAGPWVIDRELGRGGMGAVYSVVHEYIGKRAALKIVHRSMLRPSGHAERIRLEARVVNQVGHPNIIDIFETGTFADGRPYIVMEQLEGAPLSHCAERTKLLPDQVIAILLQVCDALIAAHAAGVVHRDLKLDNIFLVDNPGDPLAPKVKVIDWGIAKIVNPDVRNTLDGLLIGTPQYLSPEQARGGEVGPQTDVYSLGVVAYELFLEQLPFEAETSLEVMAMHLHSTPRRPSEIWPNIPTQLEELLLAMLGKQREDRPSVTEVADRLQAVRAEFVRRRELITSAVPGCAALPIGECGSGSMIDRPLPIRRGTTAELAPTNQSVSATLPRRPKSHSKYALGVFAIAAGAIFYYTTGEPRNAAATTAHPYSDRAHAGAAAQSTPNVAAPAVIDPEPRPSVRGAAPTPAVIHPESRPSVRGAAPTPAVIHPESRLSVRGAAPAVAVTPRASKPASKRAAALSARASRLQIQQIQQIQQIDPDGTLDPYQ